MKSRSSILAVLALLLVAFISLPAQERGGSAPRQDMPMHDMMANCKEHCQKTTASIDQLQARINEAKQSNDPARLRSALEEVQKPLSEMKEHMNMCMSMMSMMGNMHGNMMATPERATPARAQEGRTAQTVRVAITEKGFEPSTLSLKPNVPAKLTFVRQTNNTCATSVVIPEYKINKELPLNKPVVVEFTSAKTGEFAFACGMNMLKGKLLVQESK